MKNLQYFDNRSHVFVVLPTPTSYNKTKIESLTKYVEYIDGKEFNAGYRIDYSNYSSEDEDYINSLC